MEKEEIKEVSSTDPLLKSQNEFEKQRLNYNQNLYDEDDDNTIDPQRELERKHFKEQRHLYDHKSEKKDPLIDIVSKPLKNEYNSQLGFLMNHYILNMALSIIIFFQDGLILKEYKTYTEVVISQIFSAFLFFNSLLLLAEILRNALRDQIRYKLHKILSLSLSLILLCVLVSHFLNIFALYNKYQEKLKKCERKKIKCKNNLLDNIIIGLGIAGGIGIVIEIKFMIWVGYNAVRVLMGYEKEVFQKQIMEFKRNNNENNDNNINNEVKHKKQD